MGNTQQKPSENSEKPQEDEEEEEEVSTFTCDICIEPELLPSKKFNNNNRCVHPFCTDCIIKYIQIKLEDNASEIKCPGLNCEHLLDPLSCRPKIPPQLFDKWCDVLFDSAILGFDDRVYCPNRDCSALIVNECGGNVGRSVCPNCKKLFCFRCELPWHAGYGCEESRQRRDRNDVAFGVLVERNKWTRCPRCRHFVELVQGCPIVKCRCGTNFCYKCGKEVDHHWCNCDRVHCCTMVLYQTCTAVIVVVLTIALLYLFAIKKK